MAFLNYVMYSGVSPCFSFEYVVDCYEVEFTPCQTESEYSHLWLFGDGDTSTLRHPMHIYSIIDTFLVTHIVSDSCNHADTTSLNVIVNGITTECCPDTVISANTTWNEDNVPNKGRFHTITVEHGVSLTIEGGTDLLFCEGGALIIQHGGYVDLEGTLTSYGEMTWLGVFVEGDTSLGQHIDPGGGGFNGLQQGMIFTRNGSMIRNAKIGIRNYGPDGYAACGGMIRCEGTSFINNTIGVEFGPYQNMNSGGQPVPSLGSFRDCSFITTDDYFIQEPFFGFVRLRKTDGMRFAGCDFINQLIPELPSEVAEFGFGLHAVSSGFEVYAIGTTVSTPLCESPCVVSDSTRFSGLGHGIYVMTQDKTRPYSVYQSQFENCFRGITSIGSTGGTMLFNRFLMGEVPDTDFSYGQIGVELHFDHNGFTIEENQFIGSEEGEAIPIGLLCDGLGEFDNEIRRNTFTGIEIANQAFGGNADTSTIFPGGLRYFCNTIVNTGSHGYDIYIPNSPAIDLIHLYQTPGSSQGSNVSAGNHFAYTAQDFMNFGEGEINYWYYPPGDNEEPRDSFSIGISDFQGDSNSCEISYCAPPCIEIVEDIKEDFINHIDDYEESLDYYLDAFISENQGKIDTSRSIALYYRRLSSRDVYTVLQHLMIDTLEYHTDSLMRWMGYLDTYGAEVMIAGEYAAAGDFENALDVLETVAVRRDLSPAQSLDLDHLLDIYYLLAEKPLQSLSSSDRSFLRNIAYLNTGASSGISRAILSSHGEYIPLPYYHGNQIHFRNVSQDSSQTFFSTTNHIPLKIYPNPTSGDVMIEWENQEFKCVSLFVYNLFGEKVLELKGDSKSPYQLDTYSFSDGMHWIVAMDNGGKTISGKFILQRNK